MKALNQTLFMPTPALFHPAGGLHPPGPGLLALRESPRSHGDKPEEPAEQPGGKEWQREQLAGERGEEQKEAE